jgi:hypothetical protein
VLDSGGGGNGGGGSGGGHDTGASGSDAGDASASPETGPRMEGGAPESGAPGCASLPLCDNFDEDTAGQAPPSSKWSLVLGCNASQTTDGLPDGGQQIEVDNSQHHSGTNSVRVSGGDSCGDYFVNTSAFASIGTGDLYARFWVMFSGLPTTGHNGFLSMYSGAVKASAIDDYNNTGQLRLGFQGGVVVWNSTINGADSTLPDIDSTGEMQSVMTPMSQWSCIELHINQATAHIEFKFQAGATSTEMSVAGLSYDGTAATGETTWASSGPTAPLELQTFGLGWLGLNNQYTVWYDDVALSGAGWIGCE